MDHLKYTSFKATGMKYFFLLYSETWLKSFKKFFDTAVSNIQENGIEGVQKEIEKELHKWKDVKIRLAIIGDVGCGKSSFINAIRG